MRRRQGRSAVAGDFFMCTEVQDDFGNEYHDRRDERRYKCGDDDADVVRSADCAAFQNGTRLLASDRTDKVWRIVLRRPDSLQNGDHRARVEGLVAYIKMVLSKGRTPELPTVNVSISSRMAF